MAPSSQSQSPEPIHIYPPLQDGEHYITQGHYTERGPNGATGSEGRIPLDSHSKGSLEISEIPVEGSELRVQNTALWPSLGTKSIHKITQISRLSFPRLQTCWRIPGEYHPLVEQGQLHLATWRVSGRVSARETFQR